MGGLRHAAAAQAAWAPKRADARPATAVNEFAHRADLQGLRAVAVLLVALSHAGVSWLGGGFVGVDVFFVLSGFVITGLLLRESSRVHRVSLAEFYSRRVRRILPAAILTLVVTDLVAYRVLNFVRAKQVVWDSVWATFFAANVHFGRQGTDYFARSLPPSPLQHFWTLSVEEQFYIVWPALLGLTIFGVRFWSRHRPPRRSWMRRFSNLRLLIIGTVLTAASLTYSVHTHGSTGSYFSTFARAWELGLGACLAVAVAAANRGLPAAIRAPSGWAGLAMIAAAGVTYSSSTPFPGMAALLPTLGAVLIIVSGLGSQTAFGADRFLTLQPMRYVGDRSYTLYLWHWPVLILAAEYEGHSLSVATNLALLAGAFALSVATYALYENPLRRMEWSGGATTFAATSLVGVVILVAAFVLSSINSPGTPGAVAATIQPLAMARGQNDAEFIQAARVENGLSAPVLPAVSAAVRAASHGAAVPAALAPPIAQVESDYYHPPPGCAANDGQTRSRICRLGDRRTTRTIVVIGDSHAQMYLPAILAAAEGHRWSVIPLTKSACSPNHWLLGGECQAWFRWALTETRRLHPAVVLVTGAYSGAAGTFETRSLRGLATAVTAVQPRARSVAVLADAPGVKTLPVDCLLRRHATLGSCVTIWEPDQFAASQDLARRASELGARFIDTSGWFCSGLACPMVINNTIAYRDVGHVTQTYSRELAPAFWMAFRAVASAQRGRK